MVAKCIKANKCHITIYPDLFTKLQKWFAPISLTLSRFIELHVPSYKGDVVALFAFYSIYTCITKYYKYCLLLTVLLYKFISFCGRSSARSLPFLINPTCKTKTSSQNTSYTFFRQTFISSH